MTPQEYYMDLIQRGRMSPAQAMQEVEKRFGRPQTRQQQEEQAAKQKDRSNLVQAGGIIGGVVVGNYIRDKAGKWFDKLTGEQVSEKVVEQVAQKGIETGAGAGVSAGGQAISEGAANLPNIDTSVGFETPDFKLSGKTTTIDTPAGAKEIPVEMASDSSFLQGVDWGKVGQGVAGALQLYSAYKSYKGGDKVGAGISGLSGAGNIALATGAAQQGGQLASQVIPGLNIAAGGYGAYQTAKQTGAMAAGKQRDVGAALGGGMSGLSLGLGAGAILGGATAGSVVPVVGTIIGAAAGYLGSKYAGSKKDKGQMTRDAVRSALQERGVIDDKFQGTLADGSTVDFGQDGSKLNTKTMNKLASENPAAYQSAVDMGDVMSASYGFLGDKGRSLARMYVKNALSNAKDDPSVAMANMRHFAKQQGITYDLVRGNLDQAKADGRIDDNEYNRLLTNAQQLTGGDSAAKVREVRPEAGKVNRLSAGVYRDAKGKLIQAPTMREALEQAYGKTKEKKEEKKEEKETK